MTDDEFRAWLSRDNEERCVLVDLDYIKEATDSPVEPVTETLYLSDRKYFDFVTNKPYVDVVKAAPQYTRALSGDRLGIYVSSVGTFELNNADGQLDFMLDLACDGSAIRFYCGGTSWPLADFKLMFSAIAVKVTAPSFDQISVTLKDTGILLDKSIGGTSTVGGTGANADRARPADFGYIHNLALLVLDQSIGGGRYVYADDGTGTTAPEVRDRGVSVAFTDNFDGTLDLTAPPDGMVTADVLAEPDGSGNVAVSDAMSHLVGTRAGLSALSLYAGAGPTFTVHDGDDYLLGISLPEARNVIDLLTDIVDSGNCFWAVKRTGEFTFGRLRLNDIAQFTDNSPAIEAVDIREDDIDQGTFRIENAAPQYYRFQAFMSRNWHRQTDFAGAVTQDEQALYSRPGLYLLQDPSAGTDYASAPELYHKTLAVSPVIDTLLSEEYSAFDTDTLAQWMETRRAMQLPWIQIVSCTVGVDFYQLELGDPVRLHNPRFGEDDGVLFQVISIVLRLTDAKMELKLARRNVIQEVPSDWTRLISALDESQPPYEIRRAIIAPIDLSPPIGGAGSSGYGIGFGGGDGGPFIGVAGARAQLAPSGTFDKIVITTFFIPSEWNFFLGQMRYGNGVPGGSGEYTDLSTFTSENSGATLNDFDGLTGTSAAIPSFGSFTISAPSFDSTYVFDSTFPTPDAPFDGLAFIGAGVKTLTITFNTPIRAWGAQFAGSALLSFEFYLGATLVHSGPSTVSLSTIDVFDTFRGYAL